MYIHVQHLSKSLESYPDTSPQFSSCSQLLCIISLRLLNFQNDCCRISAEFFKTRRNVHRCLRWVLRKTVESDCRCSSNVAAMLSKPYRNLTNSAGIFWELLRTESTNSSDVHQFILSDDGSEVSVIRRRNRGSGHVPPGRRPWSHPSSRSWGLCLF